MDMSSWSAWTADSLSSIPRPAPSSSWRPTRPACTAGPTTRAPTAAATWSPARSTWPRVRAPSGGTPPPRDGVCSTTTSGTPTARSCSTSPGRRRWSSPTPDGAPRATTPSAFAAEVPGLKPRKSPAITPVILQQTRRAKFLLEVVCPSAGPGRHGASRPPGAPRAPVEPQGPGALVASGPRCGSMPACDG